MNTRRPDDAPSRQQGSLSVELALLLAFVLMPLLAAVVDFGQLFLAQAVVTRAAREGALAASRNRDVDRAVVLYLQNAGYSPDRTTIATSGERKSGTPVTVEVRYDTSNMVIIPWSGINANTARVVGSATERQS
ncbi:MAG TPA: pilus assembly protein [Solidesulfovibrio sp.]|nr:TadE-like protein [Desulfovibrio sp.]HML62597.1 pilus assembly protein [Solidesulfovibrio sp.]